MPPAEPTNPNQVLLPTPGNLKRLLALLRKSGVGRFACGGLEIEFDAPLAPPVLLAAVPEATPDTIPAPAPPRRYQAAGAVPFNLIEARSQKR